jgi:hypothetical protein
MSVSVIVQIPSDDEGAPALIVSRTYASGGHPHGDSVGFEVPSGGEPQRWTLTMDEWQRLVRMF